MTVEYLPVGIACNISCKYCYQDPMREAGNINVPRNWERVKQQLTRLGSDFSVFGGEPLLTPISHLKEVFEFGFQKFGKNGIQTNGSLITDEHIALFEKYNVSVGISIDGPYELNSVRCTTDLTEKTMLAIRKLCDIKRFPSIITTIHKGNNDLNKLTNWFSLIEGWGVRYLSLHELEVDCGRNDLALDEKDNIDTFLRLYFWSKGSRMTILPFNDIINLLTKKNPQTMCVWNHCDPLTTPAVQGVNPNGEMSNCGRTNKDGINWRKGDSPGFERYLILYNTPQEFGGCKGCKYFIFCKGHCPGTAIDGDWRNRTVNCRLWYTLFDQIETDLKEQGTPVLSESTKYFMEKGAISYWSGEHGDSPHGDAHGDSPHGDDHGDHSDIPVTFLLERPS